MFKYVKKFFLVLSFLCILPSVYAMENNIIFDKKEANRALGLAIVSAQNNNFSHEQDWQNIRHWLEKGADPNYKTRRLRKPLLTLLIEHSDKNKEMFSSLFDCLLQQNVDPNCRDHKGRTPLHILAIDLKREQFNKEIIKKLLDHRANPNARSLHNETVLVLAAKYGNNPIIELLIQHKANVNKKNHTAAPLFFSITYARQEATRILLNAGALPTDIKHNVPDTVFHAAIQHNLVQSHINIIITTARFDSYPVIVDQKYEKINIIACCLFNRYGIPRELHARILSMLPPIYFQRTKGLWQKLLALNYKHPYLCAQVNQRIAWLNTILKIKNERNRLASYYSNLLAYDSPNFSEIHLLFNGERLSRDFKAFNENFPEILYRETDTKNLICEMYHNCAELLIIAQQNKT